MKRCLPLLAALTAAGCGSAGSPPGPAESVSTQTIGGFTTRLVGAAQPPVVSAAAGSTVTGIAGATITDLTQIYVIPDLRNTRIAFTSKRGMLITQGDTYAMNADGTNLFRISSTNNANYEPAWSPDGTKLAVRLGTATSAEIFTMNAAGVGLMQQLTSNNFYDAEPSWSPLTSRIVFRSDRDGNPEIYQMNADGTSPTRLTNNPAEDTDPVYSPDGFRIAFVSNRGGNRDIYLMAVDGTGQAAFTGSDQEDIQPAWSPDGTRLAWARFVLPTGGAGPGNYEIYTANIDGSDLQRLTNNSAHDLAPSWSPDGTRLTFTSLRDGNEEIYVMNANGTGQTRLTTHALADVNSTWSPYLRPKYIGSGGSLAAAAAGFLVGKRGAADTSVLAFDTPAADRPHSRIEAVTDANTAASNLVFSLTSASGLSSLKFVNLTLSPVAVGVALPSGTTAALVLYDAATGLVANVLPYAANRSVGLAPVRRAGGVWTFTANFTALFDAQGRNLCPHGAHAVEIDPVHGKLLGYR